MHAVIVHPHCEIFLIRCYLYQCVYFQNKTLPNVEDLMLDSMGGSWADPKGGRTPLSQVAKSGMDAPQKQLDL